jgi:GTPase
MLPIVAIVGRPNVGKSTLYNVLTRTRDAIVADQPGVTRDRQYGVCRMSRSPFIVVDTGGLLDETSQTHIASHIKRQANAAIEEADLVLFILDAKAGLHPLDRDIAKQLRTQNKIVLLVANKVDGQEINDVLSEATRLGFPEVHTISAAHQRGIAPLLDTVASKLGFAEIDETLDADDAATADLPKHCRVAFIGRPNVGKSTLVNRLMNEERVLAFDQPGTTRDSIYIPLERGGKQYTLIDTAGIRRKAKVDEALEKFSIIKALQAIEVAHVVVVLLDATAGVTEQDSTVIGHALEAGRSIIIAINKWDGLERSDRSRVEHEMDFRLSFISFAKRVPISALHGSGLGELLKAVDHAYLASIKEFSASELTEALNIAFEKAQPPLIRGHAAKLRYAHQGGRRPPRVVMHGSRLTKLPESYKRYLENFLRERYKLVGTPIRLEFKDGDNPFKDKKNVLTTRQVQKKRRLMRHVKHR